MHARLGPRFGIEVTIIIVVAILGGLLELPVPVIVGAIFAAWVVVAVAEVAASRRPVVAAVAAVAAPAYAVGGSEVQPAEPPRAWNVWDLERRLQERAGAEARADDDLSYLLLFLRAYANPDGSLPVEFDALVRESFGELVAVER